MAELFKLVRNGEPQPVKEAPFGSEKGLEDTIEKNPAVLGDVQILARQYDTRTVGVIDLLAVDEAEKQLVVIELKNLEADASTLLQALRYGAWVRSNIDTVRLQYYKEGAANVDPTPKLAIVAPRIQPLLVELGQYIAVFNLDFVEVRRYKTAEGESFIVVDRISREPLPPPPPPRTWRERLEQSSQMCQRTWERLKSLLREEGGTESSPSHTLMVPWAGRRPVLFRLWPLQSIKGSEDREWLQIELKSLRAAGVPKPLIDEYHERLKGLGGYHDAPAFPWISPERGFHDRDLDQLVEATHQLLEALGGKAPQLKETGQEHEEG